MSLNRLLKAGIGFGLAALALRKKRSSQIPSGEDMYNKRDATLLGLKVHQTDIGGPTASHIKEGIGRSIDVTPGLV